MHIRGVVGCVDETFKTGTQLIADDVDDVFGPFLGLKWVKMRW